MTQFLNSLLLAFIPLFVAIDVLGAVPVFISLTDSLNRRQRHRLIAEASITALVLSFLFLIFGDLIFSFLGITENDFRVGGGIVLLVLAIEDIVFFHRDDSKAPIQSAGVVPIGVPLMMGPAALTTILILVDTYGYIITIFSILLNLLLTAFIFWNSDFVMKIMGDAGSKAFAKVAALLMAAIAIMMIRVGLMGMIGKV